MSTPTEAQRERIRNNRADVAALMLAGVDDPATFATACRTLTAPEAAEMCAAALMVGRDVLALLEDPPRPDVTMREILTAVIDACREVT